MRQSDLRHVPSPQEAEKRLGHIIRFLNLSFEVNLGDGWRPVRVGSRMTMRNQARPQLSLFVFRLEPLVLTPYLPEIGGTFFASRPGFERGVVSWIPTIGMGHLSGWRDVEGPSKKVGFRAMTQDAQDWFVLQLARASGARYRSKQLIRKDRYEYTREP